MCSHQQMLERKASREASFSPFVDVFGNYFHSPFHVTTITGIELKSKIPKRDHKKQKMVAVKVDRSRVCSTVAMCFSTTIPKAKTSSVAAQVVPKTVGAKAAGEARKAKSSAKSHEQLCSLRKHHLARQIDPMATPPLAAVNVPLG